MVRREYGEEEVLFAHPVLVPFASTFDRGGTVGFESFVGVHRSRVSLRGRRIPFVDAASTSSPPPPYPFVHANAHITCS